MTMRVGLWYVVCMSVCTYCLCVWPVCWLLVWMVWVSRVPRHLYTGDLFDSAKGALMVVCVVCWSYGLYHVRWFIALNVWMAVALDISRNYVYNAAAGCVLLWAQQTEWADVDGWLWFPASWGWLSAYTAWNCVFTYEQNYAPSTRLVLVVPWCIAVCAGREVWMHSRMISLLLHLCLRSVEYPSFYEPGKTRITPAVGTVQHNDVYARMGGLCSLLLSLCCGAGC